MQYFRRILCIASAAVLCAAMTGCAASDKVKDHIDDEAEKRTTDIMRNFAGLNTDAQFVFDAFRKADTDLQASALDTDFSALAGAFIWTPAELKVTDAPQELSSQTDMVQALLYRVYASNPNLGAKKAQIAVKFDSDGSVLAAAVTDGTDYGTYPNAADENSAFSSINDAISFAG